MIIVRAGSVLERFVATQTVKPAHNSHSKSEQGDRVVVNAVMMLGAQRAVLVPFRFQSISAVPSLGGSGWVSKYWGL